MVRNRVVHAGTYLVLVLKSGRKTITVFAYPDGVLVVNVFSFWRYRRNLDSLQILV